MTETNTPPWDTLPTEVLEAIFCYLCPIQLKELRLMCRHWNSAICHSPALMEKFVARVSRRSMAELLQVLRILPNLPSIEVEIEKSDGNFDAELDFELENLKTLKLEGDDARFIDPLSKICSKLKVFKYNVGSGDGQKSLTVGEIMPIIQANLDSLQKISLRIFPLNGKAIRQILSVNSLQLKALSLTESGEISKMQGESITPNLLILLFKKYSMIEDLKLDCVAIKSKMLNDLSQNMKQLRSLSIQLHMRSESTDLKVFLKRMPQLERLDITFNMRNMGKEKYLIDLDLRGVFCPNLKELKLSNFMFRQHDLGEFFRNSPNIRSLTFAFYIIENVLGLLQCLSYLKSLEFLHTYEGDFDEMNNYGFALESVRTLETNKASLARCCPNVETLLLEDVSVRNADVLWMLTDLPNLKDLTIQPNEVFEKNMLTDATLDHLATHGQRLKRVFIIFKDNNTSQAARDRTIKALKDTDVDFMVDSASEGDSEEDSDDDDFDDDETGVTTETLERMVMDFLRIS